MARGGHSQPAVDLKFSLLQPPVRVGCCTSPFWLKMVEELGRRPQFALDPAEAEVLFVDVDTLRMCEFPRLLMRKGRYGDLPGCRDSRTWPDDADSYVGIDRSVEEGISDDCNWCCANGSQVVADTIAASSRKLGPDKTFVFFKNAQDTHFECQEFITARDELEQTKAHVVFAGFQLQRSQISSRGGFLPNVNLLVPLLPDHSSLPESDVERQECPQRRWLASFSGQRSSALRDKVFALTGRHPRVHIYQTGTFGEADPTGYEDLLRQSTFGLVPRGDEHYTFRLTEVIAAGAIPVVIDDDFVAPFNRQDMEHWAVLLPESDVASAPMLLESLSGEAVCSLKRNGSAIWRRSRTLDGMVDGLLEGLAVARRDFVAASGGDLPTTKPQTEPTTSTTSTITTPHIATTASKPSTTAASERPGLERPSASPLPSPAPAAAATTAAQRRSRATTTTSTSSAMSRPAPTAWESANVFLSLGSDSSSTWTVRLAYGAVCVVSVTLTLWLCATWPCGHGKQGYSPIGHAEHVASKVYNPPRLYSERDDVRLSVSSRGLVRSSPLLKL